MRFQAPFFSDSDNDQIKLLRLMQHHTYRRRIFDHPERDGSLVSRLLKHSIDISPGIDRTAFVASQWRDDVKHGDLRLGISRHARGQHHGQTIVFTAEIGHENPPCLPEPTIYKDSHIRLAAREHAMNRATQDRATQNRFMKTHQHKVDALRLGNIVDVGGHVTTDE